LPPTDVADNIPFYQSPLFCIVQWPAHKYFQFQFNFQYLYICRNAVLSGIWSVWNRNGKKITMAEAVLYQTKPKQSGIFLKPGIGLKG
jgi:hypothetical protein